MADHEPEVGVGPDTVVSSMRIHRLEQIIDRNRVTIAGVVPVVGAVILIASAEGLLPEYLAYNAALLLAGTLVMRSPVLVGAAPLVDLRALALLAVLIAYTYGIELVGVATGIPYGAFEYGIDLGPMVQGVPLGLPLFYLPLVLNAYLLTVLAFDRLSERRSIRILIAISVVIAIDLVLDPAAVAIGFWAFDAGGTYYGVPLSNYLGWLLSATISVILLDLAVDIDVLRHRADTCPFILDDFVSFVLLWGTINLVYLQLIPVLIAGGLLFGLLATGRYEVPASISHLLDRHTP